MDTYNITQTGDPFILQDDNYKKFMDCSDYLVEQRPSFSYTLDKSDYKHIENAPSISQCADNPDYEGVEDMSVLIMGAWNNEIYCIADSRSMIGNTIETDSWRKVLYYKPLNILVGVTGVNRIRGKNVVDVLEDKLRKSEIPFSNKRNLAENMALFIRQQKNEKVVTNLFVGFFDETMFNNAAICSFDIDNLNIRPNVIGSEEVTGNGAVYACDFAQNVALKTMGNAEEKANVAAAAVVELQKFSSNFFNPVTFGGDIRTYVIDAFGNMKEKTWPIQ